MPKLRYNSKGEYMPNGVVPAKLEIPQWYKDIKMVNYNNLTFTERNVKVTSPKNCVPFLDAMTAGYLVKLWVDVYVSRNPNGTPKMNWYGGPDPIVDRPPSDNVIPIPAGHTPVNLGWESPFIFQAPKGYSALITHPFNRHDLPFTILSGIVDLDVVLGTGVFPFFLKEDFEGVIPMGTPLFQVLPFKREDWNSERDESLIEANKEQEIVKKRQLLNWYRDHVWVRKSWS